MKSTLEAGKRLRRKLSGAVITAAALTQAFVLTAQAQFPSPEGTWDMLSSGGGQKGIAFFTFTTSTDANGHFLFSVSQLQAAKINNASAAAPESRGTDGADREGSSSLPSITTNFVVFGFFHTDNGTWAYDSLGRIVGSFAEPVAGESGIITNAISFVGKVVPGKSLVLKASTSFGTMTYRGKPQVTLTDLSGSWQGFKKHNGQSFLEFFTLTPSVSPNLYSMTGAGPSYTYADSPSTPCVAMVSAYNKIGFSLIEMGGSTTLTNGVLRATVGSFFNNKNGIGGKTKGVIEPFDAVRFDATHE